ncbi:hypothetical protein OIV83_002884 [Microbotryomycetes sp. JL201]|nr:hypothetical protein OIV83_002884 [Microbotryomycetes sp. JL201]
MSLGAAATSKSPSTSGGIKPLTLKPAKPSARASTKTNAFGGDDDDDEDNGSKGMPSASALKKQSSAPPVVVALKGDKLTKRERELQQQQLALDETVYEYDEVYDSMKQGERIAQEQRKQEASERKAGVLDPLKFGQTSSLIETAELRKRDRLRAEDKMVQREREREGDEFADKDQFVTPAYLAQQEELRRIEEEEKKKEELEAKNAKGLSAFFKTYLDANDKVHEQAVAAAQAAKDSKTKPLFTVEGPPKEKSEAEIASEFERKTGKHVDVNDDGEIVDKRQLMSGGLNIVAKKQDPSKSASSAGGGFSQRISDRTPGNHSSDSQSLLTPGMSKADRARQARERHSREIERQMVALEEKRKREAEEQLQNKVEKFAKRNDESKVERLKREAEERRKKREQEAANA